MYKHYIKRIIDVFLSLVGIIVFIIPMFVISILIKIDSKGPIIFKQDRIGLHKKTFKILKFRSMPIDTPKDTPTHLLQNPESLLSPFQLMIRKFSIDELPQLFNIFVGQMSFIGPRPALWNQYDLIAERDKYGANDVKPGLTGWAQINGRDELEIHTKAKLDGEYANNISFGFDCKCFFGTVKVVMTSDGVVEGGTGALIENDETCEKVVEV